MSHPKILCAPGPSNVGAVNQYIISNADRANIWNRKVLKKFRKSTDYPEKTFNSLLENYYVMVSQQLVFLKDRRLLKDMITCHLFSLHATYIKLQQKNMIQTNFYLDTMEKLLCLACNLELEVVTSIMQDNITLITQKIIGMLRLFLFDGLNRILHVLLQLNDEHAQKLPYKMTMNVVYNHFLITNPITDTTEFNFCRYYLLCQKWKKTKNERSHSGMDKFMYLAFNKSPEAVKKSKFLKQILEPDNNEALAAVDMGVNLLEAKIIQFFKCFEQTKEEEDRNNIPKEPEVKKEPGIISDGTFEGISDGPNEVDFINGIHNTRTNIEFCDSETSDVIVIDDDDDDEDIEEEDGDNEIVGGEDSDVEVVAVDQNEASTTATLSTENLLPVPTSINTTDTTNTTYTNLTNSALVTGLNNFTVTKNKKTIEMDAGSFKIFQSIFDKMSLNVQATEKGFTIQNKNGTVSSRYTYVQKNGVTKVLAMDTEDTEKEKEQNRACNNLKTRTEAVSEYSKPQEEAPCERNLEKESPLTNILTKVMVNSEVQTSRCSSCLDLAKEQICNVQSHNTAIETVSKRACKSVEVQTDNSLKVANMYHYLDSLDTPPSDMDNNVSSPNNSYQYIEPINEYIKQDEATEFYSETQFTSLKIGDCSTQVYQNELDAVPEDNGEGVIKTQDETCDSFHYTATVQVETPTSIENECNKEMDHNLEGEPHVLLTNSVLLDVDCLKTSISESTNDDMSGDTAQSLSNSCINASLDSDVCSYNSPDVTPSAYQNTRTHELRKQPKERKKRNSGNLRSSSVSNEVGGSVNNLSTSIPQNAINVSLLRSPMSTRAATKRKRKTYEEELPKSKKVNFANVDNIVHINKEQQRRISNSVAEQAKDSMCVNNIHRHDNKLIYLEPCIPISIMSFTKFLEEDKLRQINTYNRNINNIFINTAISLKEEPVRSTMQRIDYHKFNKTSENVMSNTPSKYSKITFCSSKESGFTRTLPHGGYSKKNAPKEIQIPLKVKCEASIYEDLMKRQPRVMLTLRPLDILLASKKCRKKPPDLD